MKGSSMKPLKARLAARDGMTFGGAYVARRDGDLRRRALGAYERGRIRVAMLGALPFVALAIIAACAGAPGLPAVTTGGILFTSVVVLRWRGRELGRGAAVGGAAGLLPFTALHVARLTSLFESQRACAVACVVVALASGAAAGVYVGRFPARSARPVASWASATFVAALTGALGCLSIGVGATTGLVLGVFAGSVPLGLSAARQPTGSS